MEDLTVIEGEAASMTILVVGSPKPDLEWFKDNAPFPTTEGENVIQTEGSISLQFAKTQHSDSGVYKVVAKNVVGESSATAKLTVNGKAIKVHYQ